jgi:hypothetical protein
VLVRLRLADTLDELIVLVRRPNQSIGPGFLVDVTALAMLLLGLFASVLLPLLLVELRFAASFLLDLPESSAESMIAFFLLW